MIVDFPVATAFWDHHHYLALWFWYNCCPPNRYYTFSFYFFCFAMFVTVHCDSFIFIVPHLVCCSRCCNIGNWESGDNQIEVWRILVLLLCWTPFPGCRNWWLSVLFSASLLLSLCSTHVAHGLKCMNFPITWWILHLQLTCSNAASVCFLFI